MPQLDRLGCRLNSPKQAHSSSTDAAEEDVFWALWTLLAVACSAHGSVYDTLPHLSPINEQPPFPPMYDVSHCGLP